MNWRIEPLLSFQSMGLRLVAAILTSTSPVPGRGWSTSSYDNWSTSPYAFKITAFIGSSRFYILRNSWLDDNRVSDIVIATVNVIFIKVRSRYTTVGWSAGDNRFATMSSLPKHTLSATNLLSDEATRQSPPRQVEPLGQSSWSARVASLGMPTCPRIGKLPSR